MLHGCRYSFHADVHATEMGYVSVEGLRLYLTHREANQISPANVGLLHTARELHAVKCFYLFLNLASRSDDVIGTTVFPVVLKQSFAVL